MVRELDDADAIASRQLTTFTYILCLVVRMSREHIVVSIGVANKMQYLQRLWALSTEASFSAILTDTLYL